MTNKLSNQEQKEKKMQELFNNINNDLLSQQWLAVGKAISKSMLYCYTGPIWTANAERIVSDIVDTYWNTAKQNVITESIFLVKRKNLIEPDKSPLGKPTRYIAFNNVVIDTDTFEEVMPQPEMYMTNIIPHNYIENLPNPEKYLKFLSEAVDEKDIPIIQELDGSCLMTKNSIKNGFLFIGPKDSRKTVKCLITMRVIGEENCSAVPGYLYGDKFSISKMYRKNANISSECTQHTWKQSQMFKAFTGGDNIQMEEKFYTPFMAIITATMIQGTNIFPTLENVDMVTKQRWIVVEFPNRVDVEDMNLDVVDEVCTEDEIERIISWSMRGLKRLLKNKRYSVSDRSKELWKEWFEKTEPLETWLRNNIEIDENAPKLFKRDLHKLLPIELQDKYSLAELSMKLKSVFIKATDAHKYSPVMTNTDTCWTNIKVKVTPPEPPEVTDTEKDTPTVPPEEKVISVKVVKEEDTEKVNELDLLLRILSDHEEGISLEELSVLAKRRDRSMGLNFVKRSVSDLVRRGLVKIESGKIMKVLEVET